jgi:hypothetical protein
MPTIDNQSLYDKVKRLADTIYKKPSAYKSGYIVKRYKELGGTYTDDNEPKNLQRWYQEKWQDVGHKEYPVYRPTKRINKHTPLTPEEIDPTNLKKQIKLKQEIKGEHNLPKFENNKEKEILKYSNPKKVFQKAKQYLGQNVEIELSTNPKKKYMVYDPHTNKWIHFGQIGFDDYTRHLDPIRRHSYLQRTLFMKGNWKLNKYSPNNLSRHLLWDA